MRPWTFMDESEPSAVADMPPVPSASTAQRDGRWNAPPGSPASSSPAPAAPTPGDALQNSASGSRANAPAGPDWAAAMRSDACAPRSRPDRTGAAALDRPADD